ncbi:MAG: prepilin-type N-terminal cleavage/methylation domain-containing protein [Oligoflexia bacterium]|nr:prepilin-type N-terminal cleavage/methylation domain-containing protein [Oligoflexia bacterium]MBF0364484.1 prepilin-type N-terminal cleavage/methylation domain-containing protein [Oligoflexia bacterium]
MKIKILAQMIEYKKSHRRPTFQLLLNRVNNQQGLTLIEVMISLVIMGIVLYSINFSFIGNRDKLNEVADNFERAIRFSAHEAVIRGAVVRLHFSLGLDPQEWSVEYGTDHDFVMPLFMMNNESSDATGGTLADEELREKVIKEINSSFQKIIDFQEENATLPDEMRVIAVSSNLQKNMIKDGDISIYSYPSGERDAGLIVIGLNREVLAIKIDPFTDHLSREYRLIDADKGDDELAEQDRITKEIFEHWIKE